MVVYNSCDFKIPAVVIDGGVQLPGVIIAVKESEKSLWLRLIVMDGGLKIPAVVYNSDVKEVWKRCSNGGMEVENPSCCAGQMKV